MTNVNYLAKNLDELAELDKETWKAFRKSQHDYMPPMFNPFRALSTTAYLVQKGYLKLWQNYFVLLTFSIISAIFSLIASLWLLAPYSLFIALAAVARNKYVEAYATEKLNRTGIVRQAFGVATPSLATAGVLDIMKSSGQRLTKDTVGSLIKLNKSSQEYEDVSFGILETLKKAAYGLPFALALWWSENTQAIARYKNVIDSAIVKVWWLQIFGLILFFCIVASFYNLILADTIMRREKRKYLLVLNMIYESYQEKRK